MTTNGSDDAAAMFLTEISAAIAANIQAAFDRAEAQEGPGISDPTILFNLYVEALEQNIDILRTYANRFETEGNQNLKIWCEGMIADSHRQLNLLDKEKEPSVALKDFASGVISSLDEQGNRVAIGWRAEKVFKWLGNNLDKAEILQKVGEGDLSAALSVFAASWVNSVVTGVLTGVAVAVGVVSLPVLAGIAAIGAIAGVVGGEIANDLIEDFLEFTKEPDDLREDAYNSIFFRIKNGGSTHLPALGDYLAFGTAGDDQLSSIYLYGPSSVLIGGSGDDTLHGAELSDKLSGGSGTDSLTGDAGNDVLNGGAGNDNLHGGRGADLLEGGEGFDTYEFHLADFTAGNEDIILDSDASGKITFGNVAIGDLSVNGVSRDGLGWETQDRQFRMQVVGSGDSASLIITHRESGSRIVVRNWSNGDLSITLPGLGQPGTPENSFPQTNGDDLVGHDGDPDEVHSGNDFISGLGGNDGIDGGYGNDWLDGGHGNDLILGGPGANRLIGGLGDDILIGLPMLMAWTEPDDLDAWYANLAARPEVVSAGNGWFTQVEGSAPVAGDATQNFIGFQVNASYENGEDPWVETDPNVLPSGDDEIDAGDGSDVAYGGEGDDVISGGTGNDLLVGGSDDDYIQGEDGHDLILGDDLPAAGGIWDFVAVQISAQANVSGNDTLTGGLGNDRIYGQGGNDLIDGGAGDDILQGDRIDYGMPYSYTPTGVAGSDYIDGGDGDDQIFGDGGSDTLLGGAGADYIVGDSIEIDGSQHGADTISGGIGDDIVLGLGGNDEIRGGEGNDLLLGDASSDVAPQYHGNDTLHGDAGDDQLQGNGGNDYLDGGTGQDLLAGQEGNDTLQGGAGNDELQGGIGDDALFGGKDNDRLFGQEGNDTLSGDEGVDELHGGAGDDRLSGGAGIDTLGGGEGNDTLDGGAGNDILDGEGGDDIIYGGDGGDTIDGDDGHDVVHAGTGADSIYGGAGNDLIHAEEGNDVVSAAEGDDQVYGGADDDTLYGNDGNDVLVGGIGNDNLFGGIGDDVLDGGAGDDVLDGGSGVNTYHYSAGSGHDLILSSDATESRIVNLVGFNEPDGISFDVRDGSLIITFSEQDSLTIEKYVGTGSAPAKVYWADGREISNDEMMSDRNIFLIGGWDDLNIHGYGGDDWIWAGYGNDILYGDDGNDELIAELGDDVIYGGSGNDLIYGDIRVTASSMEHPSSGNDQIYGGEGDDSIYGSGGDDLVHGDEGSDYIFGGWGRDVIKGGAGDDDLGGGGDGDTYLFGHGHGVDHINENQNSSDIDRVVFDSSVATAEIFVTRPGAESVDLHLINRSTGDRIIIESFFNLAGEAVSGRIDRVEFSDGTVWTASDLLDKSMQGTPFDDNIVGNYTPGDTIDAGEGHDLVTALDHDDTIFGNAGNDLIKGGAGNDVLDGGTDSDMLMGDGGNDHYRFGIGSGLDFINNGTGQVADYDVIELGAGIGIADVRLARAGDALVIDLVVSGDRLVVLGHFSNNDSAWDGGAIDALRFADGSVWSADDILQHLGPDLGPISVRYGGVQYVQEQGAPSYIIGSQGARGPYYGDQESATLFDVGKMAVSYSVAGNSDDVVLYGGNAGDTYVYGRGYGRQFIHDTGGNDSIRFSADLAPADVTLMRFGDELIVQLSAEDTINIQGYFSGVNVLEAMVFADGTSWNAVEIAQRTVLGDIELHGTEGDDTLIGGVGNDRLYGQSGQDVLDGGARDDLLDGGTGADIMRGGFGSDTYVVDDIGDLVVEGIDETNLVIETNTVHSTVDYTLGYRLHRLFLEGDADLKGIGNADSNIIVGNAGNNVLNAGPEGNWMGDWIDGGAGDDVLIGSQGEDTLIGGYGADVMQGGAGQDFYFVDNVGDVVAGEVADGMSPSLARTDMLQQQLAASSADQHGLMETISFGSPVLGDHPYREGDTVAASVDYILGDNIEALLLFGQAVNGTGNGMDNRIDGSALDNNLWGMQGDDRLWGDTGNDVLYGGHGSDSLEGGHGNDRLVGGDGSDYYFFNAGDGADTIDNADASGSDQLSVWGVSWDEMQFSRQGDDLVLSLRDDLGSLTFTDWYVDNSNRVDYLYDTNGSGLAADEVDALLAGDNGFARSSMQRDALEITHLDPSPESVISSSVVVGASKQHYAELGQLVDSLASFAGQGVLQETSDIGFDEGITGRVLAWRMSHTSPGLRLRQMEL